MKNKIGYEFEFLIPASEKKLLNLLTKNNINHVRLKSDLSIKRDSRLSKLPSSDNWEGWEIVTKPLPASQAYFQLEKILAFISKYGITNSSCGLHINISNENISQIDELKLISLVEEEKIAKMFNRENNPYCELWKSRFDLLYNEILPSKKIIDKKSAFADNIKAMIIYSRYGLFPNGEKYEIAKKIINYYSAFSKYASINFSKLSKRYPYIEFRMIGGKNYQDFFIKPLVKELIDNTVEATKSKFKTSINKLVNQYDF